jgi:hypothetical protein
MVILLVFRAARNAYPGDRDRQQAALGGRTVIIIQSRGWTNSESESPEQKMSES